MLAAARLASGRSFLASATRRQLSSAPIRIDFEKELLTYECDGPPEKFVETTKEELVDIWKLMYKMRRMELTADQLYKNKQIRGFCHLYDGQEAVCAGMEAAITRKDSVITSYRDHCQQIARGDEVQSVFAELMGKETGCAKGKGGSMHMYFAEGNFFGGNGIVGAQAPLGAGLAFAHKYKGDGSVAFTLYGDGAANQGQLFEAMNMAALWKLPVIFVCENNQYGMGTSTKRGAAKQEFYKRGQYIPGMAVDGMHVLHVRQAVQYAAQHCRDGKGPFVLECDTYRYHGHSMSDPGITYRDRTEVSGIREKRDPVNKARGWLIEKAGMEEAEIKAMESAIRKEVEAALSKAKEAKVPDDSALWTDMYRDQNPKLFIRGCDATQSVGVYTETVA